MLYEGQTGRLGLSEGACTSQYDNLKQDLQL